MSRYYYSDTLKNFLVSKADEILGVLSRNNEFSLELSQRSTWVYQINALKTALNGKNGEIFFEYSIPRMGQRIDVVLIIKGVIFVLEFKVGESAFTNSGFDQVFDYALDLKNFHETSRDQFIAPILIATESEENIYGITLTANHDKLLLPIRCNTEMIIEVIEKVLQFVSDETLSIKDWIKGRYSPTPTIIEAAMALYRGHNVKEISSSDASATNLSKTSKAVSEIILQSKTKKIKSICFVTGVPGAGKTLVGLDTAARHISQKEKSTAVFLSGNGPLVSILREALTRDKINRERKKGIKLKKGEVLSQVKLMIQNVHHFRDDCIKDSGPPFEHVAIFDEAQRAWNKEQTIDFMKRKKGERNFSLSEPEFLISCLDRHKDWAVVVCLVGGGQEINVGEAGISEWLYSIQRSFPNWHIHISNNLTDSEYAAGKALDLIKEHKNVFTLKELHLSVSRRSFRAEKLSQFVKNLLDINISDAKENFKTIKENYPFVVTRNLSKAKKWLKENARGTERYGIIASSQAQRLKPHALNVKSPMDPIHWFLDSKEDVRSSYYLEDVATEFSIQGLELDWACVTWDADFRYSKAGWKTFSFVGTKWHNINKEERKTYLKNAYRVLLTRARQGMVIVVPDGDKEDHTRQLEFYDTTFNYLKELGIPEI